MNSLASLPVVCPRPFPRLQKLGPQTRRRVLREVAGALRRGTLCPAAAVAALKGGPKALALLLVGHAASLELPSLPSNAFEQQRWTDQAKIDALLTLAQSLVDAGRLPARKVLKVSKNKDLYGLALAVGKAMQIGAGGGGNESAQPIFAVATRAECRLVGQDFYTLTDDGENVLVVEVIADPAVCIPASLSEDERAAIYSALDTIVRVDRLNLLCPPEASLWATQGWLMEQLSDLAITAPWCDGQPYLTPAQVSELCEEFGGEDGEPDTAHFWQEHVAAVSETIRVVKAKPEQLRELCANTASDVIEEAVAELLDIAHRLEQVAWPDIAIELEDSEDAVGLFVLQQSDRNCPMLDQGLDNYGLNEVPARAISFGRVQNATQFWKARDCVVMSLRIVTEVPYVIKKLRERISGQAT